MSNDELKLKLAYVTKLLFKLIINEDIDFNEIQSLENIMDDLEVNELKEDEFRW